MEIVPTFTIILILGILRSTIAVIPIESKLIGEQSVENIETFLRNKCEKNGGPTAYDNFITNMQSLPVCLQSVLDVEQLAADSHVAMRYGGWNSFFKKYCAKAPYLELCITNKTDSILPCLDEKEQKGAKVFDNVTSRFLEYICQDDGDRIASFVASGGVQCLISKKEVLLTCLNETFAQQSHLTYPENLFILYQLTPEECIGIKNYRTCTLSAMETCDNQTPTSIMRSIFEFYEKELRFCDVDREGTTTSAPDNSSEIWSSTTPREFIPSEIEETFVNPVRTKCESNGGPRAYEIFEEGAELILKTYGIVANNSQIIHEMDNAAYGEELVNVYKKYCRRAPILKGLIKYAGDSMKNCLRAEEQKNVDIVFKIKSLMLEFICSNESERISMFVDSGGIECLGFKGEAFMNCAAESFGSYNPNVFSIGANSLGLENLKIPFAQAAKFCTDVDRFRDCSVQVLNQCGDTATNLNLLKSAVDLIHKEIPCGNFTEETSSSAPGSSSIHSMRTVSNEVFKQYLEEKCESNHTSTEYDVARTMPYYISKYVQLLVENLALINLEQVSVTQGNKFEVVFEKFCEKVSTAEERMQLLAKYFETCPYVRNQEVIDVVHNTTSAIEDYFCNRKGLHLARFMATNGTGCWNSMKASIETCVVQYFPTHVEPTTSYGPFKTSHRVCNYHVGKLLRCYSNLEYCENELPFRKLMYLIDHVVRVVPCRDA